MPKAKRKNAGPRSLRFVFENERYTLKTKIERLGSFYMKTLIEPAPPFRLEVGDERVHVHATQVVLAIDRATRGEPLADLPPRCEWDAAQRLLRLNHSERLMVVFQLLRPDDPACTGSESLRSGKAGDYRISVYYRAEADEH